MATKRVLSVFTLAMINVAAIASLRALPMMAEYGLSLIFYFALAAIVFFVPTALVSAELATGWPKTGGVYIWVRRAMGPRWGFVAIWLQWIENVIWYPTILSFVAGTLAMVSTWIVGPSKGIMATAHHGDLPPLFQKMNKHGMPVPILVLQGIIVTLLSLVFLLMPTVSSSYWILTALTAQLYLTMYLLMFIAAIKLRYKYPKHPRAYKVPGGNKGMWCVAGVGALACCFAIVIGFFPPSQIRTGDLAFYEAFLAVGMIVMCVVPLIIPLFRKRSWKSIVDTEEEH